MTQPGGGLVLDLILNTARARQQLQRDMQQSGQQSGEQFRSGFRSRVGDLGREILPLAGAGIVVEGFRRIVNASTSLSAAVGANRQVFKTSARDMEAWGDQAASSLGLAKGEALAYANSLGALFQAQGKTSLEAAKMSQALVDAGASLAAFKNIPVAQAQEAIAAGFRGEYDSLQQLLPQVSDAAVVQHALSMGLAETSAKLTAANKATALYSLILSAQQTQAGKAERSQGSLSISLDKAKAKMTDQAAVVGNLLVPGLKQLADVTTTVGPAFVIGAAGAVLLARRMQANAAANGTFIQNMTAARTATLAQAAALRAQQAQYAQMTVTQAIANRSAIVANNQLITSTAQTAAAQTGLGGAFGRLTGTMSAARAQSGIFASSMVAVRAAGTAAATGVGALTSALGGPFGIALVAATIGVGVLISQHQKEIAVRKAARQAIREHAQAVAGFTVETDSSRRATAAKFLADKGVLAQAERAGFSTAVLTEAYAGNKRSIELLNEQLQQRADYLKAQIDAEVKANGKGTEHYKTLQTQYAQTTKLQTSVKQYSEELVDATNKQQLMTDSMKQTTGEGAGPLRYEIVHLGDAWDHARKEMEGYKKVNDVLFGAAQGRIEAAIDEQEAIDDLAESIKENGKTLDITTEAGRKNTQAVTDRIKAAYALAQAEVLATGQVSAATQARIDGMRKELIQMGFNKEQVDALLASYRQIKPEYVSRLVVLDGKESIDQLSAVGQAAMQMIAQYNLTPEQAYGLAQGRDPRAVFGQGYGNPAPAARPGSTSASRTVKRAYGGRLTGPGSDRSDNLTLKASPDEYVVQAPAARKLGYDRLDYINATGELPYDGAYADGGRVEAKHAVRKLPSWKALIDKSNTLFAQKQAELKAAQIALSNPGGSSPSGDPNVARIAYDTAKVMRATDKAILALMEAGVVESGMRNLNYGDRDSLGFLQQRASWGSAASRMNVGDSTRRFVSRAMGHEPWKGSAGTLAQKVQVSAFPRRYDEEEATARAWIAYLTGGAATGGMGLQNIYGGSAGMMAHYRKAFPGLRMLSGFRPGSVTLSGNRSYHALNRATDTEPRLDTAKYIWETAGAVTKEHITPYQQYNIKNGRHHTYTGAVWNQHNFAGGNAHNHWAVDKPEGSIMNPGDVFANYTRSPEAVLGVDDTARFKAIAAGKFEVRLDGYSIDRIVQALHTRPAELFADGQKMADTVFRRLELD